MRAAHARAADEPAPTRAEILGVLRALERAAVAYVLIGELADLARHQVQCVVIGGYAAVLAGVDIVTRDIDITPAVEPANLQRLADALTELLLTGLHETSTRTADQPTVRTR
jgi:hypothetical protein